MGGFIEARKLLLGEPEGKTHRPAKLESFGEVLGFISLNGDGHVGAKLRAKGEPNLSYAHRQHLVRLALQDLDWMDVEIYEGESLERLQRMFPRLRFTHFCMNGADDVLRFGKYMWSGPKSRFITMGRPGFTEEVAKAMVENHIDPEAGYFILGPELPEISSTDARMALTKGDRKTVARLLHPRVSDWCFQHGPYTARDDATGQHSLQVGATIRIEGLKSRADLNQRVGILQNYNRERERWLVQVEGLTEPILVKAENLRH